MWALPTMRQPMLDPRRWLDTPPVLQRLAGNGHSRFTVLRDDLIEGGSKMRFLPFLAGDAAEVVYGGPFCGAAAWALSVWARDADRRATLFYAAREALHWRQEAARANGARLEFVRPGYLAKVQKEARDYAAKAGAHFLPLGFDVPAAIDPLTEFAHRLRGQVGTPDQIWCATGSGMLARVIAQAFPDALVCAVAVGLASRHDAQAFGPNVRIRDAGVPFATPSNAAAPFPACANYERKAWAACVREARGNVLFWNVAGDAVPR
jgi:hypothetical protein